MRKEEEKKLARKEKGHSFLAKSNIINPFNYLHHDVQLDYFHLML